MLKIFELSKAFERYKQIFKLKTPFVEFEPVRPSTPSTYEVVYLVKEQKVIIRGFPLDLKEDMLEICATIKLGEKHPLLCTFFFQEDADKDERIVRYCGAFVDLCQPLKDAWTWQIIKAHLPKEEFEKEIQEVFSFYKRLEPALSQIKESSKRRIQIGTYLVLYSLGYSVRIELRGKRQYQKEWAKYIRALEKYSMKEPDPRLFTRLPEVTQAPYRVLICEHPYPHYEVRGIQ